MNWLSHQWPHFNVKICRWPGKLSSSISTLMMIGMFFFNLCYFYCSLETNLLTETLNFQNFEFAITRHLFCIVSFLVRVFFRQFYCRRGNSSTIFDEQWHSGIDLPDVFVKIHMCVDLVFSRFAGIFVILWLPQRHRLVFPWKDFSIEVKNFMVKKNRMIRLEWQD